MKIRPTGPDDLAGLQGVLDETGLFPGDMLPAMIEGFLSGEEPTSVWLTCEVGGQAAGFCFAAAEELADGAWTMLAIAVQPLHQGGGCGGALILHLEKALRDRGQRILIAETSGTDSFAQARAFYRHHGYTEEARIRDFWAAGDDKVVFWKALG